MSSSVDPADRRKSAAPTFRRLRATVYRQVRRIHFWISVVAAVPLLLLSVTGALLVFGHELEGFVAPGPVVEPHGPLVTPRTLLERIRTQKPDARVWAVVPSEAATVPWTVWLADGGGVLDVDPHSGAVLRHYFPDETPYGVVRALHRRWLVDGNPAARWARHSVSLVALVLMVQVVVGLCLWLIPGKRLARLKPVRPRNPPLAVQRLHLASGVFTACLLLLVAFAGIAMYWQETVRGIVEGLTGETVETPGPPDLTIARPVGDLDAAIALARDTRPGARLVSWRPPARSGAPVHVSLETAPKSVPIRIWVGGTPPQILHVADGQDANIATRLWHLRYWLHVGDFAGPFIRALWVVVALMPAAFVVSGLWLWRRRSFSGRQR